MKKMFLGILFVLFFSSSVNAEVYVTYNQTTKEVLFISEKKNVVIPKEDTEKFKTLVLPNDIAFYGLSDDYTNYKVQGKKLMLNMDKINATEAELQELLSRIETDKLIQQKLRQIAIAALAKDDGIIIEE